MCEDTNIGKIYADTNTNQLFTAMWEHDGTTFRIRAKYVSSHAATYWGITQDIVSSPCELKGVTPYAHISSALGIMNLLGDAQYDRRAIFLLLMSSPFNTERYDNLKAAMTIWYKTFKDSVPLETFLDNL